jgi:zinc transporter
MANSNDEITASGAVADLPEIVSYVFDGEGGARPVSLSELAEQRTGDNTIAFAWIHLERGHPDATDWLQQSGLDPIVVEALTADETRPRCTAYGDGAVLNLRGVNLNPGSEPEDMVSVRLWVEENRVVGVWRRPLMAVRDLFDAIERNQAPVSPGDLVAKLALRLADRAEPTVAALNEQVDALEELVLDEKAEVNRGQLAKVRRMSIVLRRFMVPQRDALTTLEIEDLKWLGDRDRSRVREAAERVTRLGEELDAIRDRAQVVHDQIADRRAEDMNRHMLVLSVAAALFLPLGLLTGLLGVNVGGIPGVDNPWAFALVCALLVLLGLAQAWFFKKIGLLR